MSRLAAPIAALTVLATLGGMRAEAGDVNQAISTAPVDGASDAGLAPAPAGPLLSAWGREDDDGSVQSGTGAEPAVLPRQVHGEVSAGFGSGGYTGVSGVADIPVGQRSDLVVAASRESLDDRRFRGGQQSLSVGLFLNGAATYPAGCGLATSSATPAMTSDDAPPAECGPDGAPLRRFN